MYRVLWGGLRRYNGTIFGAGHSCWGIVFWLGFWGRERRGFFRRGRFFRGSGFFCFALLSLPLLFLLLLFWWPAWVSLLLLCVVWRQDTGLPVLVQAGHSTHAVMSFLSPLSARVGRLPLSSSLFLPSLSLSLSFSPSLLQARIEP